jgi:hypothetical protein
MLFSIDADAGTRIEGWLMPDDPAVVPRVIVHLDAERLVEVEAFVFRPLLKEYNLHNTGICGFVLNEKNCPGLTAAPALEIYDADHHLLIYRRKAGDHIIDRKFFRLEPQLFRSVQLDEIYFPRFQMAYSSLDLLAEETIRSILSIPFTESIYATGRIFWRVWEPLLRDRGYRVAVVLRDPYDELAERLLILKFMTAAGTEWVADSLGPVVEAAAAPLRGVDVENWDVLSDLLAAPPDELKGVIYNPLTRLLSAQNAFDPPPSPATAVALDSLADMDAIGLRDDMDPFLNTVSAVLNLTEKSPSIRLPTNQKVRNLATLLRERGAAKGLMEMDLEVYEAAAATLTRIHGNDSDQQRARSAGDA